MKVDGQSPRGILYAGVTVAAHPVFQLEAWATWLCLLQGLQGPKAGLKDHMQIFHKLEYYIGLLYPNKI